MIENDLVNMNSKQEVFTTSRILAGKFRKQHKNVLRIIDNLKDEDKEIFNGLNIELVKYTDLKGEKRPEYILSRDAYGFIAMSLTGKDANKFKFEFIRAFNSMEKWIRERVEVSLEYKFMQRNLQSARKMLGKETKSFHYANEAKLVNWAIFGKYEGINREELTGYELKLLTELEVANATMLSEGVDRERRKVLLKQISELKIESKG